MGVYEKLGHDLFNIVCSWTIRDDNLFIAPNLSALFLCFVRSNKCSRAYQMCVYVELEELETSEKIARWSPVNHCFTTFGLSFVLNLSTYYCWDIVKKQQTPRSKQQARSTKYKTPITIHQIPITKHHVPNTKH